MRQKIVKAVAWSATQSAGRAVVNLIVFVVLARLLHPKSFGLVAMATVFTEMLTMFQDQGFDDALVQRQELDHVHLDTAFWATIVLGVLLTAGGMALAGPVAWLYGEPQLTPIVSWLSLSFLFMSLGSTQCAILRRSLQMRTLAIRSMAATVVAGVVAIALAGMGYGVWSIVARPLVATSVKSIAVWSLTDWRPGFHFHRRAFVELFAFGANIVGKRLVSAGRRRLDSFLIGYFLGATLLGYYTVAARLSFTLTRLIVGVSLPVALPVFSRLQQDPERLQRAFIEATRLTAVVAFPVFLGIAATGPELVAAVYGPQWLPSTSLLQVLALAGVLRTVFNYHGTAMDASGRPSWHLAVKLVSLVCDVTAFFLALRSGIVAIALAFVVSSYLCSPVSLLIVQRIVRFEMRVYLRQLVAPLLASLAMVAVVVGCRQLVPPFAGPYTQFTFLCLVGVVSYLFVFQLAAPSLVAEVVALARSVQSRPKET